MGDLRSSALKMYAETSEKKMTRVRIGFALLCGLAVCCSVMYITSDAGDEYMHEVIKGKDAGTSVASTDVLKAGSIYTETPDGRMRLMDYFNRVEKSFASEVATRKADIASVRAEMVRDFQFNARARWKLHKAMLKQIAKNAAIAKRNLNRAMRRTQEKFAKKASLDNRRQKATMRRNKKTYAIIAADRRENAKNLRLAVSAWQKTTAAWASATNAKITRANRHVAANAAQIIENAKKARQDLQNAMGSWNHKIARFAAGEKAANSKLGRQFKAQNKATRAWATNKINAMVAQTGAQFNRVETKMAKNRHEVDMALKAAVMRMEASLNAQKALEDKRYAQTVRNINAARAEAKAKVAKATTEFRIGLLALRASAEHQNTKLNNRLDKAAGVVRSNRAAQAKVNNAVSAEMKRMIKLGNDRYKKHLKADAELQRLINKRQAETTRKMNRMASSFNGALRKVRATLARDRKHAESRLQKATAGLYAKLAANMAAQRKKNHALAAATRRMRLDAMDAVFRAKKAFRAKISALGRTVAKNDAVVKKNAQKSAAGRKQLMIIENRNKEELKLSIKKAIATGEKRAQLVEERGSKMDKDTRWLTNQRLTEQITRLEKQTTDKVDTLALESAKARKDLEVEMKYATKSAASVAKNNLDAAMRRSVKKMEAFAKRAAAAHKYSAGQRKEVNAKIARNAKKIKREIADAVLGSEKANNAFAEQTSNKMKKLKTRVDYESARMKKITQNNRKKLKAQELATETSIRNEERRAALELKKFKSKDKAAQKKALAYLASSLKKAEKKADDMFGKAYKKLANERSAFDLKLGAATTNLNRALSKQAALNTANFRTSVKDVKKARKEDAHQVKVLRKEFATGMLGVVAESKRVNQLIVSDIQVVTGEVRSMKSAQILVNARVARELKQINRVADRRWSAAKRARGRLKKQMDAFKKESAAEVAALQKNLFFKVEKLRQRNARNTRDMARDLSAASKKLYGAMADMQKKNIKNSKKLSQSTTAASVASANNLRRAKANFASKMSTLSNLIAANYKKNTRAMTRLTGVVNKIEKANKADRANIRAQTEVMRADFNKRLVKAIATGEARAKAIEQRLQSNLKSTVRILRVELASSLDQAADKVLKIVAGKRHKIADNYLSLKAYSVAAADKVTDYTAGKNGRNLSSIGDLLRTVALNGAVKAPKAMGLGMGGTTLRSVFGSGKIKAKNSVAAVHGLVNEYTKACKTVRANWPMGLGKYLMDRLETSMLSKGVLQVDKISGKTGHYVYINGRSVGLSNKLNDFASLAARMSVYENVLAKLTSKLPSTSSGMHRMKNVMPPQWQGN